MQLRGRAREIGDYSTSKQKVRSLGGYLACFWLLEPIDEGTQLEEVVDP